MERPNSAREDNGDGILGMQQCAEDAQMQIYGQNLRGWRGEMAVVLRGVYRVRIPP